MEESKFTIIRGFSELLDVKEMYAIKCSCTEQSKQFIAEQCAICKEHFPKEIIFQRDLLNGK